ncbi:MAG: HupE/UreJ family protein, partial [Panacagrimonas sp.]
PLRGARGGFAVRSFAWRRLAVLLSTFAAALATMTLPPNAAAHEMSIAEVDLQEIAPGDFLWRWTARSDKGASVGELVPRWPQGCRPDGNVLHCGASGLRGELSFDGVGERYSAALLKIHWLDGQSRVHTLTSAQPAVRLYGSADDVRGPAEIGSTYVVLGVEHILGGIDHLLFVVTLLFVVGFRRRLVWTITAFTVAHSLTLGLSALGWLELRSAPVEATIALSILLMASEALRPRPTLSRRVPALVAFGFGLIHGLGFAGALAEIGLPQQHLLLALLTFNLGVELGQLLVVALCFGLYEAARRWRPASVSPGLAHVPVLYGIGAIAAFWSIGRVLAVIA